MFDLEFLEFREFEENLWLERAVTRNASVRVFCLQSGTSDPQGRGLRVYVRRKLQPNFGEREFSAVFFC